MATDSDGVQTLDLDLVVDSDVVAVVDPGLDMIAGIDLERGAAETSKGVTGAVAAGLVVTD